MNIVLKLNRTEIDHLFHNLTLLRSRHQEEYEVVVNTLPDTSRKDKTQEKIKRMKVTPFGRGEIPTG